MTSSREKFLRDVKWSIDMREQHLSHHYNEMKASGEWVKCDHFDDYETNPEHKRLQDLGIDTRVTTRQGSVFTIEEKFNSYKPQYPKPAAFVELLSCTNPGRVSDGWINTCTADFMIFCFEKPTDGWFGLWIKTDQLRSWFKSCEEDFYRFTHATGNRSMCRVVPVDRIKKSGIWYAEFEMP